VASPRTLEAAWRRVAATQGAAGVDGSSIARCTAHAPNYVAEVEKALRRGHTHPPTSQARVSPEGAG
jgi:tRNA-dihydrouridine synthase